MEKKTAATGDRPQEQPQQQGLDDRPPIQHQSESSLPPPLRESVTNVPVTPDITPQPYDLGEAAKKGRKDMSSASDPLQAQHGIPSLAGSSAPAPQSPSQAPQLPAGVESDDDILKRTSLGAADDTESLSEIMAANQSLALSGNIISATFNIPHSLKYHKGADWVSNSRPPTGIWIRAATCLVAGLTDTYLLPTGTEASPRSIRPLRLFLLPFLRRYPLEPHGCCLDWRDRGGTGSPVTAEDASFHNSRSLLPQCALRTGPNRWRAPGPLHPPCRRIVDSPGGPAAAGAPTGK